MSPRNAWKARDDEIARLRRQIEDITQSRVLEPFCRDLGENILLVLGQMPYKDWPSFAKTAFDYAARKAPTAGQVYKARLPD